MAASDLDLARLRAGIVDEGVVFDEGAEHHQTSAKRIRPTGDGPILWGQIAIFIGVLCFLFAFFVASTADLAMLVLGGCLVNLGLIGVVAGYIVRAISFLPGRPNR